MLQRMNELATKAANETLTSSDRSYIDAEISALRSEIDRTGSATQFNNQALLDGSFTGKKLQVGSEVKDGATDENQITISIQKMKCSGLEITADNCKVTGSDATNARTAMKTIKSALEKVSKQRSDLGAIQNRLEHTIKNLDNVVENTQSAESLIRDTDMATEMVKYSNNNILAQAGQSMLAQANQTNQGVLSLLG